MGLNYLFVDMNAYFASVEQQERPELRGRPVVVAPVNAETTCCIAASYEAKRFGIKTGTMIRDARRLCPELCVVAARPRTYVETHHRIVEAVNTCLPVSAVLSVDEMVCKLMGTERQPDEAAKLGRRVKEAIRRQVGEELRCSVGVAPNRLLAKVASDMQKPDGLTIIRKDELPDRLFELKLRDFPGIGPRMEQRLRRVGITDVRQLLRRDVRQLSTVWGSKLLGAGWWHKLRGEDVPERPTRTRSLGHSRVLPPEQRHPDEAWTVLMRLIHKAAARLRHENFWAGSITLEVHILGGRHWHLRRRIDQCQDTLTLIREVGPLWQRRPPGKLLKVGVVFSDLEHERNRTPSLFEPERKAVKLAQALDGINRRFGLAGAHFAGMHGLENQYTTRIAFTTVPNLELADA
jgi:DNA polymerase IV